MKLTKSGLRQLIKEEAKKLHRITILKEEKAKIQRGLSILKEHGSEWTAQQQKEYEQNLAIKMFNDLSNEAYAPEDNNDLAKIAISRMMKDGLLEYDTEGDHDDNGHVRKGSIYNFYWLNDRGRQLITSPEDIINDYFYSDYDEESEREQSYFRGSEGGGMDENAPTVAGELHQEIHDEIEMRMRPTDDMLPYDEINDIANQYGVDVEEVAQIMSSYVVERDKNKEEGLKSDINDVINTYFDGSAPDFKTFYHKFIEHMGIDSGDYAVDDVKRMFDKLTTDPAQLSMFQ